MTRTRSSAKAAGRDTENVAAAYLAANVSDVIERRRQTGSKDRGDLSGVRTLAGKRVVVECKNIADFRVECKCKDKPKFLVGMPLAQAEVERGNDDAIAGVVVAKRHGVSDPGSQVVFMTLRDLAALLSGERPNDDA